MRCDLAISKNDKSRYEYAREISPYITNIRLFLSCKVFARFAAAW